MNEIEDAILVEPKSDILDTTFDKFINYVKLPSVTENMINKMSQRKVKPGNKYANHKKFGGAKEIARRRAKWLKERGMTK